MYTLIRSYTVGCQEKNSSWQCVKSCFHKDGSFGSNPDFSAYQYLTFQAKVSNDVAGDDCHPTVSLGKRWPQYSSEPLTLAGSYVDAGSLSSTEYRTVVIPTSDFVAVEGDDWPVMNDVKALWFRSCGTAFSTQPVYEIMNIQLTDDPPIIGSASTTDSPTVAPTGTPTAAPISPPPTSSPVTSAPTSSPTTPYSLIFGATDDATSKGEAEAVSCLVSQASTVVGTPDYLEITPTKWHSGGLEIGCMEKNASWQCIKSCYYQGSFGAQPNFSLYSHLTFKARVSGHDGEGCLPRIGLSKRWPQYSSKDIVLAGSYVDGGQLVADEWRTAIIPIADFVANEAEWPTMDDVKQIWFKSCGTDYNTQPVYQISELMLTNDPPTLMPTATPTKAPTTSSPTKAPTESPSLATHRTTPSINGWFPIFSAERDAQVGKTWAVATNNEWPSADPSAADHAVTVHIPADQTVTYSQASSAKLDKVVVEGTLIIEPSGSDVKLTASTIVVEDSAVLDVRTDATSPYTVTIEIDGALNSTIDPQQTMVGLLSLSGNVNIDGNVVPTKMSALASNADASDTAITLSGSAAFVDWAVGTEIVLPDTQQGLSPGHWNFPNNEPNGYTDQTEIRSITAISTDADGNTLVTLESPLQYDHSLGCHAAYITRSITFITSPTSADRGHIMHTGAGSFDFKNARIQGFGRTTTDGIENTSIEDVSGLNFEDGLAQMTVSTAGTNQIGRYALHAHFSLVESLFYGNVVLYSPRNGLVPHNSRVLVEENIVIGANGSGIFLEGGLETGDVLNNFVIGTGGGTRGGDDGRFGTTEGTDMGHGGFGIWARAIYSQIDSNRAEGFFGRSPFAFFVHPGFIESLVIPDVPGTPQELAGKTLRQLGNEYEDVLTLNTFGSFASNSAYGTWQIGLDLSYFSKPANVPEGHIFEDMNLVALAKSGRGVSTIHSQVFTMRGGSIDAIYPGNTITAIFCNNCNQCQLNWQEEGVVDITGVEVLRGGNC